MKTIQLLTISLILVGLLSNCKKEDTYEVENGKVTGKITFTTKSFVPITIDPTTKQPLTANVELVGTGTLSIIGEVTFASKFKFDFTKLQGTEFVSTYNDKNGNTIETGGTAQGTPTANPTVLAIKVTEPITKGTGRFARISGNGTSDVTLDAVKLAGDFTVNWTVTF